MVSRDVVHRGKGVTQAVTLERNTHQDVALAPAPISRTPRQTIDHAAARRNVVTGQVVTNRVTDERLIDAMPKIPRERFVPHARRGEVASPFRTAWRLG